MLSTDGCRGGVPFSYASKAAEYSTNDNSFLLFDYQDWGIAVMEDEGSLSDHKSGVGCECGWVGEGSGVRWGVGGAVR